MIHDLFKPIADRIFQQDPILRKLVQKLKEEEQHDQDSTDTEVLHRDRLE